LYCAQDKGILIECLLIHSSGNIILNQNLHINLTIYNWKHFYEMLTGGVLFSTERGILDGMPTVLIDKI